MHAMQFDIRTAEIYPCAFAPDGTGALTGSQGNPVMLWNLTSGSLVRAYQHTGPVWALTWSGDQRSFLSVDGTMRLWDVDAGSCVREFDGPSARCVAWSGDSKLALSASNSIMRLTDRNLSTSLRHEANRVY